MIIGTRSSEQSIIALCENNGAIRHGHFVYASGRHGDSYIDLEPLLADAEIASAFGAEIVARWLNIADAPRPKAVAGPAKGGVALAACVAQAFNRLSSTPQEEIVAISVDTRDDGFAPSGAATKLTRGESVLLVDCVVTTGDSLAQAAAAVSAAGGVILGAVAVITCGNIPHISFQGERRVPRREPRQVPLSSLATLPFVTHPADSCPLCVAGRPIDTE
mgnify:CR=1 FL=1